jgi:hypothetical protein
MRKYFNEPLMMLRIYYFIVMKMKKGAILTAY